MFTYRTPSLTNGGSIQNVEPDFGDGGVGGLHAKREGGKWIFSWMESPSYSFMWQKHTDDSFPNVPGVYNALSATVMTNIMTDVRWFETTVDITISQDSSGELR